MTARPRLLAATVALALAAIVAGCGIPVDDSPRAISRTTASPETAVPTTLSGTESEQVSVYFLRGESLERQTRDVDQEPTLGQAIGFVLEPPPEGSDLSTAVPPGTRLLGVEVDDQVATIDLTSEINDVTALLQKRAFAQIVFTALAWEGVEAVRFEVEGEPTDAPTDDGDLAVVNADDFDPPLNPR